MYLIMDTPFEKNEVFVNRLDLSANKVKKGELVSTYRSSNLCCHHRRSLCSKA